jgi:hypothetical protein
VVVLAAGVVGVAEVAAAGVSEALLQSTPAGVAVAAHAALKAAMVASRLSAKAVVSLGPQVLADNPVTQEARQKRLLRAT